MNLEEIEEKAIQFLKQVSNPLVHVDMLQTHLENECADYSLTKDRLLEFVDRHEQFKLFESAQLKDAPAITDPLAQEGFLGGPYVILESRVPTPDQLAAMMIEQLKQLGEALAQALAHAREDNDISQQESIQIALKRTSTLLKKIAPHSEDE